MTLTFTLKTDFERLRKLCFTTAIEKTFLGLWSSR